MELTLTPIGAASAPASSDYELATALLAKRDAAFAATHEYVERHRDEVFVGVVETTLTRSQAIEVHGYRFALRDIEKAPGFPNIILPTAPAFLV